MPNAFLCIVNLSCSWVSSHCAIERRQLQAISLSSFQEPCTLASLDCSGCLGAACSALMDRGPPSRKLSCAPGKEAFWLLADVLPAGLAEGTTR